MDSSSSLLYYGCALFWFPRGGLFKVATAANFLNQQARNQGGGSLCFAHHVKSKKICWSSTRKKPKRSTKKLNSKKTKWDFFVIVICVHLRFFSLNLLIVHLFDSLLLFFSLWSGFWSGLFSFLLYSWLLSPFLFVAGTRDFVWVTLRAARDFFVFGLFNPIMGCGVWAVGHVN